MRRAASSAVPGVFCTADAAEATGSARREGVKSWAGISAFPPFRPSVHELPFPRST